MIDPLPGETVSESLPQIVSGADMARAQGQFVYRPTKSDIWLKQVQDDYVRAKMSLEVMGEMQVLRATLQRMMDLCNVNDDESRMKALDEMTKLIGELKDWTGLAGETLPDFIDDKLDDILEIIGGGVTEIQGGKRMPMSTATQINLLTKLVKEIGGLSSIQHKMAMDNFVSMDNVKVYIAQIVLATREVFSPTEAQMRQWSEKVAAVPVPKTAAE